MPTPRHKASATLVSNHLDETVRRRLGSLLATTRRYTTATATNGCEPSNQRPIKSADWNSSSSGSQATTLTTNTTQNSSNDNGLKESAQAGRVCVLNAIIMDSSDFSSAREEACAWDRRLELALPMPLESNRAQNKTRKSLSDLSNATDESSDSSGSNSTVTQASFARRDSPTIPSPNERPNKKTTAARPEALRFLVEDMDARPFSNNSSPEDEPPRGRRSTVSSVGSSTSSTRSGASANGDDNDTDHHTSPEVSPKTPKQGRTSATLGSSSSTSRPKRQMSYGTPEMPRGNANLPHVSPSLLTPRASKFGHVKHLPRAEKLPLSGYELLASRLSTGGAPAAVDAPAEPQLKPIYRRFEPLNHRLLLHLQDELCELEEQLHRLDTADTQNRRLQNGILPASRRADSQTAGELQWHKTDILGKIGFKLEQYNHVLASFQTTRTMPKPNHADVREYQGYLAANAPIAEHETRFLDATDDLVCLADENEAASDVDGYLQRHEDGTGRRLHVPRRRSIQYSPTSRSSLREDSPEGSNYEDGEESGEEDEAPVISLSLAMAVAVIAPIMAFGIVPGYFGRMTVVMLVSVGVLWGLIHERVIGVHATRDFYICAGLYGMAMAVVAGLYR
ncbi:hypothetical protein PG990_007015 [Apiospora arundinis]